MIINSNSDAVIDIEDDILETMLTPLFFKMLSNPTHTKNFGIYHDKMSYGIRDLIESGIHDDKISQELHHKLKATKNMYGDDSMYYFNDTFAYLYMVTLANKLCEYYGVALVAADSQSESFANLLRFDNRRSRGTLFKEGKKSKRVFLKQGMMLDLIINGLQIAQDVPIPDIMLFKQRHQDELGHFRSQLAKLTQNIQTENTTIDYLRSEIMDTYKNEFLPSYNNLQKALKNSRIKTIASSFVKAAFFSISNKSIPMLLPSISTPQILLSGASASLWASAVSYNTKKIQQLRENPYSYLLAVERDL